MADACAVGHGHGKLILCGEHAVVYGYPAIAFAVDLCTTVHLMPRSGGSRVIDSDGGDDVRLAVDAVLGNRPVDVRLHTDLPLGRGMGSSAALGVALVRAADAYDGVSSSSSSLIKRAMVVERIFHGNPSGLDVAASVEGGLVRYERSVAPRIEHLCPVLNWRVVVLDTGRTGNTSALVAAVAARRPEIDEDLSKIGDLVGRAEGVLSDSVRLGALLNENQALLARIGVSSPEIDALVALALGAGAHGAKLSGAGGGGVVMALVDDPNPVLEAARARGIPAWDCAPVAVA